MKLFSTALVIFFLSACSSSKNNSNSSNSVAGVQSELPACLLNTIKKMAATEKEGMPQYVTMYDYKGQKVFYVASSCCDKLNVVYDKNCKVLGYPDGGLTGKGDGSLPNFRQDASNPKAIWSSAPADNSTH